MQAVWEWLRGRQWAVSSASTLLQAVGRRPSSPAHDLTGFEQVRHDAAVAGWSVRWTGLHWELKPPVSR